MKSLDMCIFKIYCQVLSTERVIIVNNSIYNAWDTFYEKKSN